MCIRDSSLAVRKKVMVSLMYPSILIVLVVLLMVFLVTYVVPTFANLYNSMQAKLPIMTVYLIAIGTASQKYIVFFAAGLSLIHISISCTYATNPDWSLTGISSWQRCITARRPLILAIDN